MSDVIRNRYDFVVLFDVQTPLPRIDLLRRFVSCCFFSVFFVYLSHPG